MSNFVLDTNIVLHYTRINSSVAKQVEDDYGIRGSRLRPMVCVVTLGEIRAFAQGWPKSRVDALEVVLSEMLVIDIGRDDVLAEYARLHKFSKDGKDLAPKGEKGKNISHNDLWIAAAAKAVGASVLTTDADLLRLPAGTVGVVKVNAQSGITEETVDGA